MSWTKGIAVGLLGTTLLGCASESDIGSAAQSTQGDPGALVSVTMTSKVGVLLDELPPSMRPRVAAALLAKPSSYWVARAKSQVRLATYRLVFRQFFYGGSGNKKQMPLPPEDKWQITLGAARRETVRAGNNGVPHDLVTMDYRVDTTILTDEASPGVSEAKLAKTGGVWREPFIFPIDPELIMQRTGYACMDEEDFPYNSVDSEEADTFYDQDCGVENKLSNQACHQTELPTKSCIKALEDHVGKFTTELKFTRLAWDSARADSVRVGPARTERGADLEVYLDDFKINRIEYKYFAPNSCEVAERCIKAPGWRRVLQFNSSDENVGRDALDIGAIDYYLSGEQTLNDRYHVFDYSDCHGHYHFSHYGEFSLAAAGAATTNKQGFCLQSTNRVANHEDSPLHNPYGGCDYQGVAAGWVDQYKIGLPCQWVDITDVTTTTAALSFTSNPDGFLCEGEPVLDASGAPVFEPTAFRTPTGEVVYRPKCTFNDGWFDNNSHSYNVPIPAKGESYVTQACDRGQVGPLRNCGWKRDKERLTCTPGAQVTLRCTAQGATPQAVRVCEHSQLLGSALACTKRGALASSVVEPAGSLVTFTCPTAKALTPGENGGTYSLYTGAAFPEDAARQVTCTPL